MNKFRLFAIATTFAVALITPTAFAQAPVNISIISGNGQISCSLCTQEFSGDANFSPLYVKVTDANGNPVANATVNWTVVTGPGSFLTSGGGQTASSVTDNNGNTNVQYLVPSQALLTLAPYNASTVSASIANNAFVNFYLTQALLGPNSSNPILISNFTPGSSPPCPTCLNPGDLLTGAAGSTSNTQFQVQVYAAALDTGVPNVSLRLIPNQANPTISCATGAGADPGSVLTDSNGIATCTAIPRFC